ncbi:hypothetical protein [Pseudomonas sp. 2995-3]|jgi:hypothetical protein|uniref:hypothetical protein n=1 Tax=Pseudomonas sp. 2995-3 TaxID=1712680 RepID=UPI000C1455B4|nr:hypothetical protein [Pseudomonas sp. 2995-3]
MNEKIRLNGKQLISTYNLIIPNSMRCEIDVELGAEFGGSLTTLPLTIFFQQSGGTQNVTFTPENGRSLMTLINWSNSLGTALNTPYELAKVNNAGVVEMLMVNSSIGGTNHLTLQLWWREVV